jgi:hypothetical protein
LKIGKRVYEYVSAFFSTIDGYIKSLKDNPKKDNTAIEKILSFKNLF